MAIALAQMFDQTEALLVEHALNVLSEHNPTDMEILRAAMAQVASLAKVLANTPSLKAKEFFSGHPRSESSLVLHLCKSDGLGGDLELPFKATLSRTLLIGKVQFLRGFVKAIGGLPQSETEIHALNLKLREELAQSIYTQLAEEILLALLRKANIEKYIKARAAEQLIAIWDDCALEIDDFCPLLESTWHARNRITTRLGTLLGASEYFRLVAENCAPQFLDFFARDEVSSAESQAFEEFLFNVTFEELTTLRQAMRAKGVEAASEDFVNDVLHRPIERECISDEIEPMTLYRSYYRRQIAADFRNLAGIPGPRRTAEAYLMIYLLQNPADA